jgi:nitrite reductase/ring-hydroxylating ferredoxin subunit
MALFLCKVAPVAPDQPLRFVLPSGDAVAVFNVGGTIFVTDDTCTHGDASLAEGYVEGFEIECPFHMGRFDVRTGEPTAAPCTRALRVYPVTIEDGSVFVDEPA